MSANFFLTFGMGSINMIIRQSNLLDYLHWKSSGVIYKLIF